MVATIKNVIVIGASGGIGSSIFKSLVASSKFTVSVLTRLESTNKYAPEINTIVSDYSEASLVKAFTGQDAVISVLGAASLSEEPKVIDAAVAAGVKLFLPSQFSTNSNNAKACALLPAFAVKAKTIEHLKKQESKGLSWTGIAAGPAFDWGAQMGLAGFNINNNSALIIDGGNRKFSATNLSQISNAVIAVLSSPEKAANEYIYIDSFTATQNEILAAFEKATGKKWEVTYMTSEAAEKEGKELFSKGDFSGLLYLLKVNILGEGYGSNYPEDCDLLANGKLGLPKQSLEDTVAALAACKMVE